MQQISVRSATTSTGWRQLVAVRCLPELMSLCRAPQNPTYRAWEPENFPLNSQERPPAVERSQFEPAEHRPAQRETDSEWLRHLLEPEFQVGQPGSPVATTRRGDAMAKCFEGLESPREVDLPLVKNPAHRQECQLPLAL